jgi:hypothetical protein
MVVSVTRCGDLALERGKLDVLGDSPDLGHPQLRRIRGFPLMARIFTWRRWVQPSKFPWNHPELRRAAAMAIPITAWSGAVFGVFGPAADLSSPVSSYCTRERRLPGWTSKGPGPAEEGGMVLERFRESWSPRIETPLPRDDPVPHGRGGPDHRGAGRPTAGACGNRDPGQGRAARFRAMVQRIEERNSTCTSWGALARSGQSYRSTTLRWT